VTQNTKVLSNLFLQNNIKKYLGITIITMSQQPTLYSYFEIIERLVYTTLYNLTYLFSILQIRYNRFIKYIELPLLANGGESKNRNKSNEPRVELFFNGGDIQFDEQSILCGKKDMTNMLHFLQNARGDMQMSNDSMLVYTNPRENGAHDKVVLRNGDKIRVLESDTGLLDYEQTECGFISFEMVLEDLTTHQIQLKNGNDNYYIVGNVIDRAFIAYYAKKYLNFREAPQKYTLHVVDRNADFFTMTQDDSILFGKSSLIKFMKTVDTVVQTL
jgi:hypothetical protein